jgi:hypothetical protein
MTIESDSHDDSSTRRIPDPPVVDERLVRHFLVRAGLMPPDDSTIRSLSREIVENAYLDVDLAIGENGVDYDRALDDAANAIYPQVRLLAQWAGHRAPPYDPWRDGRTSYERRVALDAAASRRFLSLAEARAVDPVIEGLTSDGEPVYPEQYECWLVGQENREPFAEQHAHALLRNIRLTEENQKLRKIAATVKSAFTRHV